MPHQTLSIGGATYDLFVRTGKDLLCDAEGTCALNLPLGEKIRVEEVIETCGGGACNTSVGLKRLGCEAAFCGVLGSDQWGSHLLKNFQKEGVNTNCATIVDGEITSFSIILSATSGERVILYTPGTNAHLHDVTFDRRHAAGMDWIYFNHIHEHTSVIEDDLIAILEGSERPGLTWNPGGEQLKRGVSDREQRRILAKTDLLILNKGEALEFTGKESIKEALTLLCSLGVRFACVTDGKNGSIACDGSHVYRCPILAVTLVDTTGAGDAFGTAATWALLEGEDLPTALRAGTINSSSVVSAVGAQAGLLTEIEMQKQLKETPLAVDSTHL